MKIDQPKTGYRFSIDPFILTAHIKPEYYNTIIDIGCGCCIMPLILINKYPDLNLKIIGVEIQKELFFYAKKNILANGLKKQIQIIHKDIKDIMIGKEIKQKADIIISNPPYAKKSSSRLNLNTQKAIAKHEITLDIDSFFNCTNRLLNTKGKVYIIFPAKRLSEIIIVMAEYKFYPLFIRFVHIKKNMDAKWSIICAIKNKSESCLVKSPLYIYQSKNKFTKEYKTIFNKNTLNYQQT